jgi:hypothetical protein
VNLLPSDVRKAIYVVDESGAAAILEQALGLAPQGRKSALTPRLFLIGSILSVQSRRHLVIAEIYRTLIHDVDLDLQIELGIVDGATLKSLFSEKSMERFSARLSERLEYGIHSAPDLDNAERERRRMAVVRINDALIAPTLPERTFAAYAMDTSAIWAWGRAPRKVPSNLLGLDAQIIELGLDLGQMDSLNQEAHQDASAMVEGVERPTKKEKVSQPYELDADWGVKTDHDSNQHSTLEANLIEAIDVTTANRDIVAPSLRLIDRVLSAGKPFKELLCDRHYSYKLPERWAKQLMNRRIEQVVDLHPNDQGFRDYNGAKLAAAVLHCPGTPDYLGKINRPGPTASFESKIAFSELIEIRQQYAFQSVSVYPRRRSSCPAVAGKVGCPLRQGTVEAAIAGNRLVILNPPDASTAPLCCTQYTVEIKEDAQPKLWQREYWGSKRWRLSNDRRTYVEGAFGNLKNASGENLSRGFFRITGLARVTLFLGIAATAHNMRQLGNWHERTLNGDPHHPLLAPDSETLNVRLTMDEYAAVEAHRNESRLLVLPTVPSDSENVQKVS